MEGSKINFKVLYLIKCWNTFTDIYIYIDLSGNIYVYIYICVCVCVCVCVIDAPVDLSDVWGFNSPINNVNH